MDDNVESVEEPDSSPADAALTETLTGASGFHPGLAACLLVIPPLVHGKVHDLALVAWIVVTVLGAWWWRQRIEQFRRASKAERRASWGEWTRCARWASALSGAIYVVITVPVFNLIDLNSRLTLTVLGAVLVIVAAVHASIVAKPLIYVVGVGLTLAWALSGESQAMAWTIVCAVMMVMAEECRKHAARRVLAHIELSQENRRLARELCAMSRLLENLKIERNDLLAAASHDLRQPVHALSLLVGGWDANASVSYHQHRIALARSRIDLLGEMLRNMLDASQLDMGLYRPDEARFDLAALLTEIFDTFSEAAAQKGLVYRCKLDIGNCLVVTDRGLLARSIGNLLGNAIKYTRSGSVDLVARYLSNDDLSISVIDTGIGIPSDRHHEIFMPYARLDRSSRSEQGLGIGLSVVRHSAALLGLSVRVISQPGAGTTMSLELPARLLSRATEPANPLEPDIGWNDQHVGHRILLVEDDPVILNAMQDLLAARGFEVRGATSIEEALQWIEIRRFRPDLLMTDLQLTGTEGVSGDGIACLRAVRVAMKSPDLPVVIVTGDPDLRLSDEVGQHMIRVLRKPLNPRQIFELMAQLLPGSRQANRRR